MTLDNVACSIMFQIDAYDERSDVLRVVNGALVCLAVRRRCSFVHMGTVLPEEMLL